MATVNSATPNTFSPTTQPGSFQSPATSTIQESPILQKPTPVASTTTVTNKKTTKLPLKAIIGGILLLVVTIGGGVGFYLSQTSQDVRQQASSPSGTGSLSISPGPTSFSPGSNQTLIIRINMGVSQVNIDGIQFVADITGNLPDDLAFSEATIPGLSPVTTSLVDTASGKRLSVAYLTTPPNVYPAGNTDIVLGTLQFTTPTSGAMNIAFDPVLSKVLQNQTASDILRTPSETWNYTFASTGETPTPTPTSSSGQNSPTPTPTTPGSVATPTPTPSPTSGAGGNNSPTPTPTPTRTPTPTPTSTSSGGATATPTPTTGSNNTPTPTPTTNGVGGASTLTPTPTPTSESISQPAQTQEVPVSGSAENTILLLLGGFLIIGSGVFLIFTAKEKSSDL